MRHSSQRAKVFVPAVLMINKIKRFHCKIKLLFSTNWMNLLLACINIFIQNTWLLKLACFIRVNNKLICREFPLVAFQRPPHKQRCFVLPRLGIQVKLRTLMFYLLPLESEPYTVDLRVDCINDFARILFSFCFTVNAKNEITKPRDSTCKTGVVFFFIFILTRCELLWAQKYKITAQKRQIAIRKVQKMLLLGIVQAKSTNTLICAVKRDGWEPWKRLFWVKMVGKCVKGDFMITMHYHEGLFRCDTLLHFNEETHFNCEDHYTSFSVT